MYGWRRNIFRLFGAKIGKNVIIRPSVKMTYPWNIEIGNNSWIGDNVVLYSLDKIEIGNNVVISQNSYLCTGTHNFSKEASLEKLCVPVHKYEFWLITTLLPISILSRLYKTTLSPIQELFPISMFHGYVIFTDGLIITFLPIFAPNSLKIFLLHPYIN